MKEADTLNDIINSSLLRFELIGQEQWDLKPSDTKWSKKEILGHLCDSAMNNIRRFVVSQYEPDNKIVYAQNEWVSIQKYQSANYSDIISLWKLLNYQIIRILEDLSFEKKLITCITNEKRTLQWLAEDYLAHLNHHLLKINNLNN